MSQTWIRRPRWLRSCCEFLVAFTFVSCILFASLFFSPVSGRYGASVPVHSFWTCHVCDALAALLSLHRRSISTLPTFNTFPSGALDWIAGHPMYVKQTKLSRQPVSPKGQHHSTPDKCLKKNTHTQYPLSLTIPPRSCTAERHQLTAAAV